MQKIRVNCRFYGRVQGVGFRYNAYHSACSLGLTGWVKNDWDESVELEIQGDRASVDRMIRRMYEIRYAQIDRLEKKELPVIPENSFQITG